MTTKTRSKSPVEEKHQQSPLPWLQLLILVAAAVIPYLMVLKTTLLSDDWVLACQVVDSGKGPLGYALSRAFHTNWIFYRPVFDFLCALNWHLSGVNPVSYHLTNIIFHAVSTILVWRLALRAFRNTKYAQTLGFTTALLFAVQARLSGAVAWSLGGIGDVSYSTFVLLTLLAHARYMETLKASYAVGALLAFTFGIFSKEAALVVLMLTPFATLFAAPHPRWNIRKSLGLWLGYLVILTIFWILRKHAIGSALGGYMDEPLGATRLAALIVSCVVAAFVPGNIDLYPVLSWLVLHKTAAVLIGSACIAILAWLMYRSRGRALYLGLLIFVVGILPHLSTNQFISLRDTMQERRMYLPMVGATLMFIAMAWQAIANERKNLFATAAAVLVLFYGVSLIQVNLVWRDAGLLTNSIIQQTITQLHKLPDKPGVIGFLGIPDNYSGAYLLRLGLKEAVRLNGGPSVKIVELATTAPERGHPIPKVVWTKTGNVIRGVTDRPYFKFQFSMANKTLDMGNHTRAPIAGPLYADLGPGIEVTLKAKCDHFLTLDQDGVQLITFPDQH